MGVGGDTINTQADEFIWQWGDYSLQKTTTYTPTDNITFTYSGDTDNFTIDQASSGIIKISNKNHNGYPGIRKIMYVRLSRLGYNDAILICTQYEQT